MHIVNSTYMSLDGVVQRPELWTFDYRTDDVEKATQDLVFAADALIMGRIRDLKARPGGAIVQYGFGPVTRLLIEHGLLDELQIWLHPLLTGTTEPGDHIGAVGARAGFRLAGVRSCDSGVAILSYTRLADTP
jgi:dihydrofolate reductase